MQATPTMDQIELTLYDLFAANKTRLFTARDSEWTDFFFDVFSDPALLGPDAAHSYCRARGDSHAFGGVARREGRAGEFLWDLCWFPDWPFTPGCYREQPLTRRLPLVLESEWGKATSMEENDSEVLYDFAKILHARAERKVMIFGFHEVAWHDFTALSNRMVEAIRATSDTESEYLFVGVQYHWEADADPLRTRVYLTA